MPSRAPSPVPLPGEGVGLVRRGVARVGPTWGFSNATEHDLVQRRIGLTYGLSALFLLGVVVISTLTGAISAPQKAFVFDLSRLTYLTSIVVLAAAWHVCRGRRLDWRVLAVIDGGSLFSLIALLSVTATYAPVEVRVESLAAGIFALVVPLRAALVPSPPAWSVLVSAVAAAPLPIAAYAMIGTGRGTSPPALGIVYVVGWCIAATIAAGAISRVVYGLRANIKSAMHFGQYTLEEKIGEGGMGVVYRARHAMLRRPTAVKLLSTAHVDHASAKRFEREVQLTSRLTHPNTIAIYDYGHTHDGIFYYAMELLEGVTLAELCEQGGPQPYGRVIHILGQAARALAEAHAVGLIHRDVKPANIFLCVRGGVHDFVKVLDFGLVKEVGSLDPLVSAPNTVAGTPLYMAPESFVHPADVDARVDIYALGAVAYCLLTGRPPFGGSNAVEIYSRQLFERPSSPSQLLGRPVAHDLEELIMACLAKSPGDRPASASELAAALAKLQVADPWGEEEAKAWWQTRRASPRGEGHVVVGDPQLTDGLGTTVARDVPLTVRVRAPS